MIRSRRRMSKEDFESFRRLVLADSALQRELQEVTHQEDFVVRFLSLARERGLAVEADDVETALRNSRREWLERWI
jgi:Nif11 domain